MASKVSRSLSVSQEKNLRGLNRISITQTSTRGLSSAKPYTVYHVGCESSEGGRWTLYKRYSDFEGLRSQMKSAGYAGIERVPFPKKQVFGNSMSQSVVAARQQGLSAWLAHLIKGFPPHKDYLMRTFLENDGSIEDIEGATDASRKQEAEDAAAKQVAIRRAVSLEQAMLQCTSFLRSTEMTLTSPLWGFGSRDELHKSMFEVSDPAKKREMVLKQMHMPPSCPVDRGSAKAKEAFLAVMADMRHPSILPTLNFVFFDAGLAGSGSVSMCFTKFCKRGSIKDTVYKVKEPRLVYVQKYGAYSAGSMKRGTQIGEMRLAALGRQVLEGMAYLRKVGFLCHGIHSANVIMKESEVCAITDFEQVILGCEPRRAARFEGEKEPDSIAFGHIVFEMAMGYECPEDTPTSLPPCPLSVKEVLEAVFFPVEAAPCPTVEELLELPFFANAQLRKGLAEELAIVNTSSDERTRVKKLKKRLQRALSKKAKVSDARPEEDEYGNETNASDSWGNNAPKKSEAPPPPPADEPPAEPSAQAPHAASAGPPPEYMPFVKMTKMGVPQGAAEMKCEQAGLDPLVLRLFLEDSDAGGGGGGRSALLDAIKARK